MFVEHRHKTILSILLACSVALPIMVNANESTNLTEEATVRTMLQIDAELALSAERKRMMEFSEHGEVPDKSKAMPIVSPAQPAEAAPPTERAPQEASIELLGIFGFGDKLFTDVMINGARVRFAQGQKKPERAPSDYPVSLLRISPPCVSLLNTGKATKKCL